MRRRDERLRLLTVVEATARGRTDVELDAFSGRDVDWAIRTGLGPLLWRCTKGATGRGADSRTAALRSADLTARVLSGETLDAMVEILAACEAHGPLVGLLKGISICDLHYPEPHLRPMGDIDLLVDVENVSALESSLERLGYERRSRYSPGFYANHHHTCPFFRSSTQDWIEVHTALIPPHSPSAADPVFSAETVAAELRASRFRQFEVRRLSAELELVYMAAHWGFELEIIGAMVPMVDVALLLERTPDLDWGKVLGWLEGSAAAAQVYLLVSFLARHGIVAIDGEVLAELRDLQRPLGKVSARLAYHLLERYVVGGTPLRLPMTERNFDVLWNTLLLPAPPVQNFARLSWRLIPDRLRPGRSARRETHNHPS